MKKREPNSSAQPTKLVRRKYDEEFKQHALTMVRNGQSVRSVAEALGISENLIHQWKRAARANQSSAELEVEQLRQRLKQVEMERDILKKSLEHFQPADVSSSYRFIASEAANYPVVDLCRTLGVSRGGYYEWAGRLESTDDLAPRVSEVFSRHSRRYGSRRIAAELQAESKIEGERIGRRRVSRLMRELELEAIQSRRFVPHTTDSRHDQRMSSNLLLERAIKVDRPRQVIVGDITFLPLQSGGWAYLATWMDLFSRKIVGWQVADSMTAELVIEAIKKAILRERVPLGLIVHFDRGGQYVDAEFRRLLDQHRFEQSMSRADETYYNAHAESLFSRYKAELLEDGAFADVEEARMETFIYIESYYNRVHRHSALGYQSPEDFERAYYQRTEARENFGHRPGKGTIAKQHSCPLK